MKEKYSRESGFTLIEILITTAIMVLLISVVLANFGGTQSRRNVGLAKDNLASDLRSAQSSSLSSKDINGVPSSSYGVHFSSIGSTTASNSYDIIAYNNSSSTRQVIKTVYLPTNTYIRLITVTPPSNVATVTSDWQGTFVNPYARFAQTYTGSSFSAVNEENDITIITISSVDGSYSSAVTINGYTGVITE